MIVPLWFGGKVVNTNGEFSDTYNDYQQQLTQQMQQNVGNEGFVIPSVTQSELDTIESGAQTQPGTLLFNTSTVNGGSTEAPNGQLFIFLADGNFHAIPNL